MRERQHWMDLFRGFAIILVITLHATTMPNVRGVDPLPWLREFFLFLTPSRSRCCSPCPACCCPGP